MENWLAIYDIVVSYRFIGEKGEEDTCWTGITIF